MNAKIFIKKGNTIDKIDRRIYGSFIEHLGRAVYEGIYEPSHPSADSMGFRGDALALIKELNVPIVRYPGGNFVSGYNWEDGIGDRSKRKRKLDLAWLSIEPNEVGIDEFQAWAKLAGTDIMMAVNLGTRGPDEARELIEYCNATTDTHFANMRRENGFNEPFGIKLWCLGNEMDGYWQICHKTAEEYGRAATETAKVLKWVDPTIELVACGSAGHDMPTFGEWERTVLDHTYDYVDYLSLHQYYGNYYSSISAYLAMAEDMDSFIKETASICDEIKAEKGSDKTVNLSFDEWNVWYRTRDEEKRIEKWQVAPHLLEEKYNFEDALLVGCMLMTLQNNCDRVKIACLAQLVNVIAPIMTEKGGKAWRQTIFYPYMYGSLYGNGTALRAKTECDSYTSDQGRVVPYLYSSVIENGDTLTVFAVNRSCDSDIALELDLEGFEGYRLVSHTELYADDVNTENDADNERITPVEREITDTSKAIIKKHSWNMLVLRK